MPNVSYAYFEGREGSCTQAGREGAVQILSMDHIVEVPVDVKDATATGTRIHGAVTLVANVDKATPLLEQDVCTSTTIPTVKIEFWRINNEGLEENYYNIEMTNVRVVFSETWYPNVDDAATATYKHMKTYKLRYDKITWTFTDGTLSAEDEWNKPNT